MQPLLVMADAHWCVEEIAETWGGEQFGTRAIPYDPASTHKDHPINLGENVAQVMGDQHQACAFGCEATQGIAKLSLRGQVKSI
jgi:hypothetical protein